jgi:predicted RNA-binding Zn ribbon-like protein
MPKASPAPHGLDLVIDFVNTLDLDEGEDQLSAPEGVSSWLAGRGLLDPGLRTSEAERAQAIALREALRSLMLTNNGAADSADAAEELERTARSGELGVHFGSGGQVSLDPRAAGLAGALARLLVPVAEAVGDGSWQRVKACRAHDCQWAFYDRSRNRSGVWCEMAVCGNRTKVRAYRERGPRSRA